MLLSPNFLQIDHPLVAHKLTYMRAESTTVRVFNQLIREIGMLLAYDISTGFALQTRTIVTPSPARRNVEGKVIAGKKSVVVPILRSGLVFAEGIKEVLGATRVGHMGLHRPVGASHPIEYMRALPDTTGRSVILVDPMVATGSTAAAAINTLKTVYELEEEAIKFACVLTSDQAWRALSQRFPGVMFYCCGVDPTVDETGRLVPGLGIISERQFG